MMNTSTAYKKTLFFASILCVSAPIFSSETPTFLKKNRKALTIAATIVAAGTAAWYGYSWWQSYCIEQEKAKSPSTSSNNSQATPPITPQEPTPPVTNTPKPTTKTEPSLYERLEIAYKDEAQFISLLKSINCTDITSAIYCLAFAYANKISTHKLCSYSDQRQERLQLLLRNIFDNFPTNEWGNLYEKIQQNKQYPDYVKNFGNDNPPLLENLYYIYRSLVEIQPPKKHVSITPFQYALNHCLYAMTQKVLAKKLINLKAAPLSLLN